ncbi:hypothetical protein TWF173_003832 [Orbilia oligospora]|uniref:CAAX prenyl protease n=2 Tax=Orbilia oligospora TaxID=2813651 RepID=G1X9B9_ARTOA|nr:hypothetical protein AOL_s00076g226 [Orbilia oligospora ATCC 24927]EGX50261.1 hypothetical protein AOL_s00076g226 [Orbilia oligospora ATCC 24927]KAF3277741.1 hypothetical protein TWF970_004994 [Orbilia oligospora]KAF3315287.1 hypothetical protein TWF173_003832 [Orbilia oligospora]
MDILANLATFFDRPLFPWKKLILGFSVAQYLFETYLSARQYKVLRKDKIPNQLDGAVEKEVFDKSQAYGRAKADFGYIKGLYGQLQNVGFIVYDVLPKLWGFTGSLMLTYVPARFNGEITHSIIFFFIFNLIVTALNAPIDYYSHFVLEEKFGFNKQTVGLWLTDMIKGQALSIVFGAPILAGFLKIVQSFGTNFFFYLWAFAVCVQVTMITIYPLWILPLFNKLTPLEPGKLKTEVEALADKLKFPLKKLYVIDGSKRSAHSNAYFYGLPWAKHIVIYDTLIEKSETEEVVAVLAHELGHWSLGHTTKLFYIAQFHMFYIFALFSVFINNRSLYRSFGFHSSHPIIIGFILFSDVLAPMDTLVKFFLNMVTRMFEYQADAFALNLGFGDMLASSLIKLQVQNLSTMDADWMYSSYHYTHPILTERLGALGWKGQQKKQ